MRPLWASHAHPFTLQALLGRIAIVGGIIHAYHAADTFNPGGSATRLLDFALLATPCHTLARTVEAVFCGVALVGGIINARHAARATYGAGSAAGQLFHFPVSRFCRGL